MKLKTLIKNGILSVRCKTMGSEKICVNECLCFANTHIRGFLKTVSVKKNSVDYTGPRGISLAEYLKTSITKYEFFFIIEQIVAAVEKILINDLKVRNIRFSLNEIFINEITKEVNFIYLPISGNATDTNVMELVESIIYAVKPADEEDMNYVSRFYYFFKSQNGFNPEKIERFIEREDKRIVSIIKRRYSGESGSMTDKHKGSSENIKITEIENEVATINCDYEATGILDDYEATGILDDYEATGILDDYEATGILDDYEATGILDDYEATGILDDYEATGILDDYEATGILDEENTEDFTGDRNIHTQFSYPTLYRISTGEITYINKPVFRIGKERSYVDYFISNNSAVSRSHADIITRDGRYFITDLNSKNHTFINGKSIPAHQELEITDGTFVRLGNEEFVFRI